MTNNKGDLISREALKKALHNFFDGKVIDEPTYILRDVFCYIDGAPTAPLPDFKEGYKQAIIDGKTNFSRLQGEWNEIQAGMFACPFCGARPHKDFKNFCAKCGADMRKGGVQNV